MSNQQLFEILFDTSKWDSYVERQRLQPFREKNIEDTRGYLNADLEDHFEKEIDDSGTRWADWSPSYKKWRLSSPKKKGARKFRGQKIIGNKILELTGTLKKGIMLRKKDVISKDNTNRAIYKYRVGNKARLYAKFIQDGTSKMPARRFAWISQKALKQIEDMWTEDFING